MTVQDIHRWIISAAPGSRMVYWTGGSIGEAAERDGTVEILRAFAWASMLEGRVRLFQRRDPIGCIEYVMVRRSGSPKPVRFKGCYAPGYGDSRGLGVKPHMPQRSNRRLELVS